MISRFYAELKRRHVIRVGVAYALVSWIIVQFISVVFPLLMLPAWTQTFVVLLLLIGLPIACVIAWAFELTPAGLVRTEIADGGHIDEAQFKASAGQGGYRRWATFLLLALVAYLLVFRLVSDERALEEVIREPATAQPC